VTTTSDAKHNDGESEESDNDMLFPEVLWKHRMVSGKKRS
jgi:hypothetical protein